MDFGASNRCKRFDLRRIALLLAAVTVTACGSPWYTSDPIEAWVVDAETGAPIEGAVVTANWQLVAPSLDTGGRKLRQLEVMETKTDKNGRFYFPGFTKINFTLDELRDEDPQILIFKSDYEYFRIVRIEDSGSGSGSGSRRRSSIVGRKIELKKETSSGQLRALKMESLTSSLMNIWVSGDAKRIPKMFAALGCEKVMLKGKDIEAAGFSFPGESTSEVDCAN